MNNCSVFTNRSHNSPFRCAAGATPPERCTGENGSVTPALLIITSTFVIIIYAMLFMLTLQLDFSNRSTASEEALHIAESGINYYRWHLAHDPDDFQDGTGGTGPYVHDYLDPQGTKTGQFSLEITPPTDGSGIVTITSTGNTSQFSQIKRKITVKYGKPSLTKYSNLSNASMWFGSGITVNGLVHTNNGIRMDGVNTSLVTSANETYTCGSETGCHPPKQKPGVWGAGPGGAQGLWQYPMPRVDFDSLAFDLNIMQEAAINEGLYLEDSNAQGYHIIFLGNGTFRVNRVTNTDYYQGYSVPGQGYGQPGEGGCRRQYQRIINENTVGIYNVSDVPIIFAEDELWIEGSVKGRITVVGAKFPIVSNSINIWIPNNLTYAAYDGTNALGVIAEQDIYFARNIPEDFKVDGALIAQNGKIIRHGYLPTCGPSSEAVKDKLTINGSLISYYKSYWNFGSGPTSGFIQRTINYDSNLLYNPPPYFPTSDNYEFISWIEE